jgi:hypothetical protein
VTPNPQPAPVAAILPEPDTSPQPLKPPSQAPEEVAIACIFPNDRALSPLKDFLPAITNYMNANGGSLSINVSEVLTICGKDLIALPGNENLLRQHIQGLVSEKIGSEYVRLLNIRFETGLNQLIAIVEVSKSPSPVVIKE